MGGTKIEGIVLDEDAQALRRRRIPTRQEEGFQAITQRIVGLIQELERESPGPCRIGICTPGSISPRTGRLRNSNTVCLNGQPLQDDLQEALGKPLAMDNDANCFALAEARLGAARGHQTVFGVILGTGVGGGIVLDGQIHGGRLGIGGEWGHHTLYPGGNSCYCGKRGCVEAYLSGPALERRFREMTGERLSLPQIVSWLDSGEAPASATEWKEEYLHNFAVALSNVIDILDPDIVVLGGGVSKIPFLYEEGAERVRAEVFSDFCDTPIVQHQLGDSAGVFGAALLSSG